MYEVDYQDTLYVAEEDDGVFDDSPEEKDSERFIHLSEMDWHIFFELDGLSEDQIEKEVFSIPKRRVTDSREPSPKKTENESSSTLSSREPSPAMTSSSASARVASSTPGRKDLEAERTDTEGNVITSKILVKGVSIKCTESTLRSLFTVNDRLQKAGPSESEKGTQSVVAALELFFFDDDSGWALVEFSDSQYTTVFQRKLNNRPLYGKSLRVYYAGKKEVENFHRAKRNFTLRRRQDKSNAKTSSAADKDHPKEEVSAPRSIQPYCFGRKLNWQVSVEQMEDSPSRRLGISTSLEQSLRTKCVKVILRLVKKLHLDREDAASAIIALNRYFTFHAMNVRNAEFMAASMLHLFLKAHSRNCAWVSFVSEVYAARNSTGSVAEQTKQLGEESDEFLATERQLLAVEKSLLEGLRYDMSGENPYALLDVLTSGKNRKKLNADGKTVSPGWQIPPSDVQKEAKHLIAETLRLPIWVQMPVECVVLGIVYLSAAVTQILKEIATSSSTSVSSKTGAPEYLPLLDGKKNELETLMLLECSLSICDSLKDRWTRLEKNAKPSRKSDDYFDTEDFALAREKPVEIPQRISLLIKSWINVPPSSSVPGSSVSPDRDDSRDSTKSEFITLSMIGKSLASTSLSGSGATRTTDELNATNIVSAAAVVPKVVAKGPGGGSTSILSSSDRLHTSEVTKIEKIRKRGYLGTVSDDVPFDLAGKQVYLQPWPYRDSEPPFSSKGEISKPCVRELSTAIMLHSQLPNRFIKLLGVVFPEEKTAQAGKQDSNGEGESKTSAVLDVEMMDFSDESGQPSSSSSTRLESSQHYFAFEQPLHMYSGIFEAKVIVPMHLKKRAICDMLLSLAVCHENNFVHRFVAPSHCKWIPLPFSFIACAIHFHGVTNVFFQCSFSKTG